MAQQKRSNPAATFEVRFVGAGASPERIPLRAVSDALSAIQDLAAGRDPYESRSVPSDQSIGLIDVRRGSAVYSCVARSPDSALTNLTRVGHLLAMADVPDDDDVAFEAVLTPIKTLSEVAKSVDCRLEVRVRSHPPLFVVQSDDYSRISRRILMRGETTIVGKVERVGGATDMRCLLRIPDRTRLLYCDVKSKDLVRRLGQHLYETVAVSGTATWLHSSWRLLGFEINEFSQPSFSDPEATIRLLRKAGLSAWDDIDDPEELIRGACE